MSETPRRPKAARLRLAAEVEFDLAYLDRTPFGGVLSRRLQMTIIERCRAIVDHWRTHGLARTVAEGETLLERAMAGAFGELYKRPGVLREDVLYPPRGDVRPHTLIILRDLYEVCRFEIPPPLVAELAPWIGDWCDRARPPRAQNARALYDALASLGGFTDAPDPTPLSPCDARFIGHATVSIGHARPLLVDPYLLPPSTRFPASYQPIGPRALGRPSLVCITHSHPDHFSPSSLFKLGADTPIVVPRVKRESALSVDMAWRLGELGFRQVRTLGWNETVRIPGGSVRALPFYGEQPTTGPRLHPEVRNQGNTYLVERDGKRYLLVADAGRDALGSGVALGESRRAKEAPIDVLFGGYRAFPQYPIEYLHSSVPQYLLFVPRAAWGQRQKIMYDADELIDLAESWRARHIVPYACGAAPWYWERGLGPILDGRHPTHRADPPPESVLSAGQWRSGPESAPHTASSHIALLRPGDGMRLSSDGSLALQRQAPHAWPYAQDAASAPKTEG